MKDYGLISIITPNYNCGQFIEDTIKSVLAQTYTKWELLIQDDCSNDESLQIAYKYENIDSRIKLKQNPVNCGAAVTRNNAIRRSKGQWLAFLDSDDIWLPNKLEKQLAFMEENNCDFVYSSYEHIDENNNSLGVRTQVTKHLTYRTLMTQNWPGCLTVMYKQNINDKVYSRDTKKNNDQSLFLVAIKKCKNAMGMTDCLALYRIRKGSISRNKWKMIEPYIKVIHEFEGHSILMTYYCLLMQLIVKSFFYIKKLEMPNLLNK